MNEPLSMIHRWLPESSEETWLLLHGTGGDEDDLLPLGRSLFPKISLLSPRGKILERGMPRFFKRHAEGVFDLEDLVFRTHELADFLIEASKRYGFSLDHLHAMGYSNGANIAASLMLLRPGLLKKAVLLRGMVPLIPETLPDLSETEVILATGVHDPIIPLDNAKELAKILRESGASVEHQLTQAGHELHHEDFDSVKRWLEKDEAEQSKSTS